MASLHLVGYNYLQGSDLLTALVVLVLSRPMEIEEIILGFMKITVFDQAGIFHWESPTVVISQPDNQHVLNLNTIVIIRLW